VQEWGHVDWFDYCLVSSPSNVGIRQVSNDYRLYNLMNQKLFDDAYLTGLFDGHNNPYRSPISFWSRTVDWRKLSLGVKDEVKIDALSEFIA